MNKNPNARSIFTPEREDIFKDYEPRRWVRKLVLYGPLVSTVMVWAVWKIGLLRWLWPLTNFFPHLLKLKTECGAISRCTQAVADLAILNIAELICFAILMVFRHSYFHKYIASIGGNLYPWKYVVLVALFVVPTWMFMGGLDKAVTGPIPHLSPSSVVMWHFIAMLIAFGQPGVEVRRYYRSLSSDSRGV